MKWAQWGNRLLLFLNIALLLVLGAYLGTRGFSQPSAGWEYKDLVAVLLTAVGVLLAATTLFVGILAIWGYTTIRESAERSANATAEAAAKAVAADVARAVASREALEAVRLHMQQAGGAAIGAEELDALTEALKAGGETGS